MKEIRLLSVGFVLTMLIVIGGCGESYTRGPEYNRGIEYPYTDTVVSSESHVLFIPVYNSSDLSPLEYNQNMHAYEMYSFDRAYPESEVEKDWMEAECVDMGGKCFIRVELKENPNPTVRRQAAVSVLGYIDPGLPGIMIEQWPAETPRSHITLRYGDKVMDSDVFLGINGDNEYSNPEIPELMSRLDGKDNVHYFVESDTIRIVDENDREGMELVNKLVRDRSLHDGQHASGDTILTTANLFYNDNYNTYALGLTDMYLCHENDRTKLGIWLMSKVSSFTLDYKWDNDSMCAVLAFRDTPGKISWKTGDPESEGHTLNFVVTKANPRLSWASLRSIPYMGVGKSWGTQVKTINYYLTEYN